MDESLELIINENYSIIESLEEMLKYRHWSESTIASYKKDVETFESFMVDYGIQPYLKEVKLHIVQKWIKSQAENNIAYGTVKRRLASLSSIYSFYKDIGIIQGNPFKATQLPVGLSNHHSPIMDMNQLKEVYRFINNCKDDGLDIELTVKIMLFTGLRNQALVNLKVKNVILEEKLLKYDAGIYNSKHKIQFFPIPPRLLELLKHHISTHQLIPEDSLLYGLKGMPLQNKQLNRITNKICDELGWHGIKRVTPHGFRASLATILDERGNIGQDAIKYLLGHSEKDNIKYYLRRDKKKINQLRKELDQIEDELENCLICSFSNESKGDREEDVTREKESGTNQNSQLILSEEILMQLLETNPKLALTIIEKGFSSVKTPLLHNT